MKRLFRLMNKGRHAWWAIAKDEESAVSASVLWGNAKKPENVTIIADQTHFYTGCEVASESLVELLSDESIQAAMVAKQIYPEAKWVAFRKM